MKNAKCTHSIDAITTQRPFGTPPWIMAAAHALKAWIGRSHQRRRLAELDDAALKDMGLSRIDVRIETDKPFWRI